MPKDTFFDEEDENLDDDESPKDGGEKTPPAKEPKAEEKGKEPEDKEDWKAKYEALEAEREDSRYYEEMLRFNDDLEGETLDDLEGGKRYRELRKLGLSSEEAYGAVKTAIEKTAPNTKRGANGKSHVSATDFRKTQPRSKMDRETRRIVDDALGDSLSEEEKENLYRRVTQNND